MTSRIVVLLAALPFILAPIPLAHAETPEEWVKLLTRVHGGFGSFLPVGIRIGEDAMQRLNAKPRELTVLFQQGEGTPCPCAADGVMLAVSASPGQGTLQISTEKAPRDTFAIVLIRSRQGGDGLKYRVPISHMAKLAEINRTVQVPLDRYNAVMGIPDLFTVEPVK